MPRPTGTAADAARLRQIIQDGEVVHPFTTGRFVALGWLRQITFGGYMLGGSDAFELTAEGGQQVWPSDAPRRSL